MKRIRGFVEPYEPDEWEEFEDEGVVLEYGFASANEDSEIETKAYTCPMCKRTLFEADIRLHGVIFIRCRKCRREVAVETTPTMRRIGF